MIKLDTLPAGVSLLRWTEQLPAAGGNDPLGLSLRKGARLANELLFCITSITPRARYYAFFPWAIATVMARRPDLRAPRDVLPFVLLHERAMVLGAVLHHEGHPCDGGGLAGSTKAQALISQIDAQTIDLRRWQHLKAEYGAFGAYQGSLINLGIFDAARPDHDAGDDEIEPSIETMALSEVGQQLAAAYGQAVVGVSGVSESLFEGSPVDLTVIKKFGSEAGLCEIGRANAIDLPVLRRIFFACNGKTRRNSHYRRRMTLLLLMHLVKEASKLGVRFDAAAFDDLTFYGHICHAHTGDLHPLAPPLELEDIAQRWRIFHFHSYLTVALQTLLVAVVDAVRDQPAGLTLADLTDRFSGSEADEHLSELLNGGNPLGFFDLSPAEVLEAIGVPVLELLSNQEEGRIWLASGEAALERRLRDWLVDGHAWGASGPALALLLIYMLVLRHQHSVSQAHEGWSRAKIENQFSDVGLVLIADLLAADFGKEWWFTSNRVVLSRLVWRFVIMQHQATSYERGFGGGAPLFNVDGERVVGMGGEQLEVAPTNARFPNAMQILKDLGFVEADVAAHSKLTTDGEAWLATLLAEEG